jgi:hypothetical protein
MKVGILTTDGGSHPPAKWAEQTAGQIADIISIDPNSVAFDELTAQKNAFEKEITETLTAHHDTVQKHEQTQLSEVGMDRLTHPLLPEDQHLDDAVNSVDNVAQTKIFGSHFKKPEVQHYVKQVIGSHMASIQHIERSWHADKNPDHEHAKAFKAHYHPGL